MHRTWVAILAAFLGGCVVTMGFQVVSASSPRSTAAGGSATSGTAGRTLVFVTKSDREIQIVDIPPAGISKGDILALNAPLYDQSRVHRIGRLDITVLVTDTPDGSGESSLVTLMNGVAKLPGGQIMFTGIVRYHKLSHLPFPIVAAVTGGTGAYIGARGTLMSVSRGTAVVNTVTLLP